MAGTYGHEGGGGGYGGGGYGGRGGGGGYGGGGGGGGGGYQGGGGGGGGGGRGGGGGGRGSGRDGDWLCPNARDNDSGGYGQAAPPPAPSYGGSHAPPPNNYADYGTNAVPPPTSYTGGPPSYGGGQAASYGGGMTDTRSGGRGGPPAGGYDGGSRNQGGGGYGGPPPASAAPAKIKQCDEDCDNGNNCDNTRIYLSNLPPDVTTDELRDLFGGIGQVARIKQKRGFKDQWPWNIKIYTDEKGNNKGDAVLTYEDPSAAHSAGGFYNNHDIRGYKISVAMAEKTAPKVAPSFGNGGRGGYGGGGGGGDRHRGGPDRHQHGGSRSRPQVDKLLTACCYARLMFSVTWHVALKSDFRMPYAKTSDRPAMVIRHYSLGALNSFCGQKGVVIGCLDALCGWLLCPDVAMCL
ncbi:hypothetical protein ACFE04_014789 [Oxalis oulophora]